MSQDGSIEKKTSQANENLLTVQDQKIGQKACLIAIVCTVVLIAHWPALSANALTFDDDMYLLDNQLVQNPGWDSARSFLTEALEPSTVRGYYQPLAMISLMFDYALGGRPGDLIAFHRTSLILHVINTALVIILLYMLFGNMWVALAMGLLFGLHPMRVETIAWVGERKTVLSALFALSSLILYVRFTGRRNWKVYLGCLVMYLLSVMSKPISLPLPLSMLLIDYWPLRKLTWRSVKDKLPFFAIAGIFAIITYISQSRTSSTILPGESGGMLRIFYILCHNIIFYISKTIWPIGLSLQYDFPDPMDMSDSMVLIGVIGTFILICLLVISMRWTKAALTGWLFFFITILPTMQIIGFSNVIAGDKYTYLPSVGFLMILTAFLLWLCRESKHFLRRMVIIVVILVLACSETLATRRYLAQWRDTLTLYRYALTVTEDNFIVHYNIGLEFVRQNELDEAISHFHRVLEIKPGFPEAQNNLGNAFLFKGLHDKAIEHYRKTLEVMPNHALARYNLGMTLFLTGETDEAIGHFRMAIEKNPDHIRAHFDLGKALELQGKIDDAALSYQQVIRIDPDNNAAHFRLARIRAQQGNVKEAIAYYEQTLRITPNDVVVINNLAWIFATNKDASLRDPATAIRIAKRACKLSDYKRPDILDTLAAAYAAAGNFEEAVSTAQTAIKLALSSQQKDLANDVQERIELYKKTEPYIQP